MNTFVIFAQAAKADDPNSWTVIGLIAGAIIAFVGGYFAKRGEDLAASANFATLLRETIETRQAVKKIEAEFAQRQFLGETEVAYRERQLAEFYGPIYGSIKSTGRLWRLWMTHGALDPITAEVLEQFRLQNDFIVDILRTKSHLVEGDRIPDCFAKFMTSVTIFNLGTRKGNGATPKPACDLPEAAFPEDFFAYIVETTELLKRNLDVLYKAHQYLVRDEARRSS